MSNPDYTQVNSSEAAAEGDSSSSSSGFPYTSFMKEDKRTSQGFLSGLCNRDMYRSYRCRRRLTVLGVLAIFVSATILATYEFGRIHGHIQHPSTYIGK